MQDGHVDAYATWLVRKHEEHYPTLDLELVAVVDHALMICAYVFFMPKPSTHRMCAQDQLFLTYGAKVLTDNQMS
jgi:hypothetical protein